MEHDCLKCILNLADASGRWSRWRLCLSEFEFDVVYRAEIKHQVVDALSRMSTDGADTTPIEHKIPIQTIDVTSNHNEKIPPQQARCQSSAYVVENGDNHQEGAANEPTFEEFLQHQATEPFYQ